MKKPFFLLGTLLFSGIVIFFSCKKEKSCEGCAGNNKPPIAMAGSDQVIVLPTDSVLLNGSASNDPDGSIAAYQWTKISGPVSFNIVASAQSNTVVKNLTAGMYQFELKVTDNGGLSAKDTMQITVNASIPANRPPFANAGVDHVITLPANATILDGSASTDPDNNITSYAWIKVSGPASSAIVNGSAVQTQVTSLIEGIYQFELKVTDAGGLFSKDTIQISVQPVTPPPPSCDISNRQLIDAQLIPIGNLSQARSGMSVVSVNNKIIFSGGSLSLTGTSASSRVDIFDITGNSWSTAELAMARWGMATAVLNNKIFFAGGQGPGINNYFDNVDVYDVSTNTWNLQRLSERRAWFAGSGIGNKVFFAGGTSNNNEDANRKVDIYEINTNNWSTAMLSEGRFDLSAVIAGDKIYFAGGSDRASNTISSVEIYNNTTNTWSASSLQYIGNGNTGITLFDKIYWTGFVHEGPATFSKVEVKDITTGSSVSHCLSYLRYMPGIAVRNNRIVFFTSPFAGGVFNNKFDIYDILTNTWSIGLLPANIYGASIISVNNTIYVAGGVVNGNLSNAVYKLEF